MSDMPITGTFYVYGSNNQLIKSVTITIQPNQQVFHSTYSYDLNLPRSRDGFAIFTHNGPPGAILADANIQNSTMTVVLPSKFESRYAQ